MVLQVGEEGAGKELYKHLDFTCPKTGKPSIQVGDQRKRQPFAPQLGFSSTGSDQQGEAGPLLPEDHRIILLRHLQMYH